MRRRSSKLPAAAAFGNPIDVMGDAPPDRYAEAVRAAEEDETIDAIIVVLTPQKMTDPLERTDKLVAAHKGRKPVVTSFMGGNEVGRPQGKTDGDGYPELSVA